MTQPERHEAVEAFAGELDGGRRISNAQATWHVTQHARDTQRLRRAVIKHIRNFRDKTALPRSAPRVMACHPRGAFRRYRGVTFQRHHTAFWRVGRIMFFTPRSSSSNIVSTVRRRGSPRLRIRSGTTTPRPIPPNMRMACAMGSEALALASTSNGALSACIAPGTVATVDGIHVNEHFERARTALDLPRCAHQMNHIAAIGNSVSV